MKKVNAVANIANIPAIMMQSELINKILHTYYLDTAGIMEFEEIRINLRNLMTYVNYSHSLYDTNFSDEVLSTKWSVAEAETTYLTTYRERAEYFVRKHQNEGVIAKLKSNLPLTGKDMADLEAILWSEAGTKEDYEALYKAKPLGEFVREIVGLDMNAAKEAFAEFLNNTSLDSRQIYFVNQIVEYIVHNGMMKDLSVLQEAPFTDRGSIVEVFSDTSSMHVFIMTGIAVLLRRYICSMTE